MWIQKTIQLCPKRRGFHLITDGDSEGDTAVAGIQSESGIYSTTTFIDDKGNAIALNSESDGDTEVTKMRLEALQHKRLFWRELQ